MCASPKLLPQIAVLHKHITWIPTGRRRSPHQSKSRQSKNYAFLDGSAHIIHLCDVSLNTRHRNHPIRITDSISFREEIFWKHKHSNSRHHRPRQQRNGRTLHSVVCVLIWRHCYDVLTRIIRMTSHRWALPRADLSCLAFRWAANVFPKVSNKLVWLYVLCSLEDKNTDLCTYFLCVPLCNWPEAGLRFNVAFGFKRNF